LRNSQDFFPYIKIYVFSKVITDVHLFTFIDAKMNYFDKLLKYCLIFSHNVENILYL